MAGLFAAEGSAGGEHLLEDVLVADGRAEHSDPERLSAASRPMLDMVVATTVEGEQAAGLEIASGDQQDGVAVDDAVVLVGEEGAVGVAVEGDAHGGLQRTTSAATISGWSAPQFSLMLRPVGRSG